MGFTELFFIAVGLSMDAFAVSVCKGLGMKKFGKKSAVIIALFFGGFQAAMPFIGWALGRQFQHYIVTFDHWIAFGFLSFIGGKMVADAVRDREAAVTVCFRLDIKEILMLSIATSIDALAVGITFAFLNVNILCAISIIGVTAFLISAAGVFIGFAFGSKFEKKAEILGGVILIFIGLKILLEHLGIINC